MTRPKTRAKTTAAAAAVTRDPVDGLAARVGVLDWDRIATDLDARGVATTGRLLDDAECSGLAALYADDRLFRRHIVMARHGFGKGEYKYFASPLPALVGGLRAALYPRLAPIANRWSEALRQGMTYPPSLDGFLARCHASGQLRPTPLLLKYGAGDYNCLHQDLYGENVFPLQAVLLLSRPRQDFEGGELVVVEQRPRMQSRAEVVALAHGEAAIFAVHHRPVIGTKGAYRVNLRHGVSRLRSGERLTCGIIFHDAE